MMTGPGPRREPNKKVALITVVITLAAAVVSSALQGSRFSAWWEVPGILSVIVVTGVSLAVLRREPLSPDGSARGAGRRGNGVRGDSIRGRHGGAGGLTVGEDDRSGAATGHRWRSLVMVARLMPRSMGGRWLAEAESLLPELPPERRGAAVRSYLRSAPELMVMMWAHEALRRARLGPRRPG
ncbi:MAG TPA: hypothetical protein VGM12_33345 [Trebonia sp.]|jgi:hypothetical protein